MTETDTTALEAALVTRQVAVVRLASGDTLRVEIANPDRIRWEQTAARRWPELIPDVQGDHVTVKAPMFMQTFMAWSALKRTNGYDGTFEQFSETDCMDIDLEDEPVDPTRPGHSPG